VGEGETRVMHRCRCCMWREVGEDAMRARARGGHIIVIIACGGRGETSLLLYMEG
jgi:hypothetical protein